MQKGLDLSALEFQRVNHTHQAGSVSYYHLQLKVMLCHIPWSTAMTIPHSGATLCQTDSLSLRHTFTPFCWGENETHTHTH